MITPLILPTIALTLVTLLSGLLTLRLPYKNELFSENITIGSGSYLFGITLLHLIPDLFYEAQGEGVNTNIGLFLLLGFFLQLCLDAWGSSILHGHKTSPDHSRYPTTLLLSLIMHALLEGCLLDEDHYNMIWAIMLHKMPTAFTLAILMRKEGREGVRFILPLVLFSVATPFSLLLKGYLSASDMVTSDTLLKLSSVATGSLLHIATLILFEASPDHQPTKSKWIALSSGFLLALLNNCFLVH